MNSNKLYIEDLIRDLGLTLANDSTLIDKQITSTALIIPGLELNGYVKDYDKKSGIVLGDLELSFLNSLGEGKAVKALQNVASSESGFLICCTERIPLYVFALCNELKIPMLKAKHDSLNTMLMVYNYLVTNLSSQEVVHGTLVNINGRGVLLKGASGIGKSEIALELIKKGHKLVADDAVLTIAKEDILVGRPKHHQKHLIEVRGLGLIDVQRLYGITAILDECNIDYVFNLTELKEFNITQRVFDSIETETINGIEIQALKLPIYGGRNIADIIEVSVAELNSRNLGYDTNKEFTEMLDKLAKGE